MEMARQRPSANESRILESDFDLKDEHFVFKLPNTILRDIFYEIRQDFIDQLRKKLSNFKITAEAEITAVETKAKPRTEQEKFEKMAQKNPDLWKLKETLDLDLLF